MRAGSLLWLTAGALLLSVLANDASPHGAATTRAADAAHPSLVAEPIADVSTSFANAMSLRQEQTGPAAAALPATPAVVSSNTLRGKVIHGYQGWFGCPGDGSPPSQWFHWFSAGTRPVAANLKVDMWPDTSQLTPSERCATSMRLPNGNRLVAYSAYNATTVLRQFQWMRQYGIDGIALQRFIGEIADPRYLAFRDRVMQNVMKGAQAYGRVFYLEYDVSGANPSTLLARLKADWKHLVDTYAVTASSRYLHEEGLPVLELWGMGIPGSSTVSARQAQAIIKYFQHGATPKYRAFVIGGVGSYWRTGTRDAMAGAAWAKVYRSFDAISPWAVGRYGIDAEADTYRTEVTAPDLLETQRLGRLYMPVIFPGFSWRNLNPGSVPNEIPRRCGAFYWRQAYNAVDAGAATIFVAMFDEVDEGTAMFKLAPTPAQLPSGSNLLPLDVDGCALPSDWYLRLGRATGRMLKGQIPISASLPLSP